MWCHHSCTRTHMVGYPRTHARTRIPFSRSSTHARTRGCEYRSLAAPLCECLQAVRSGAAERRPGAWRCQREHGASGMMWWEMSKRAWCEQNGVVGDVKESMVRAEQCDGMAWKKCGGVSWKRAAAWHGKRGVAWHDKGMVTWHGKGLVPRHGKSGVAWHDKGEEAWHDKGGEAWHDKGMVAWHGNRSVWCAFACQWCHAVIPGRCFHTLL